MLSSSTSMNCPEVEAALCGNACLTSRSIPTITLCVCARGKAISFVHLFVCLSVCLSPQKSPDRPCLSITPSYAMCCLNRACSDSASVRVVNKLSYAYKCCIALVHTRGVCTPESSSFSLKLGTERTRGWAKRLPQIHVRLANGSTNRDVLLLQIFKVPNLCKHVKHLNKIAF